MPWRTLCAELAWKKSRPLRSNEKLPTVPVFRPIRSKEELAYDRDVTGIETYWTERGTGAVPLPGWDTVSATTVVTVDLSTMQFSVVYGINSDAYAIGSLPGHYLLHANQLSVLKIEDLIHPRYFAWGEVFHPLGVYVDAWVTEPELPDEGHVPIGEGVVQENHLTLRSGARI